MSRQVRARLRERSQEGEGETDWVVGMEAVKEVEERGVTVLEAWVAVVVEEDFLGRTGDRRQVMGWLVGALVEMVAEMVMVGGGVEEGEGVEAWGLGA